jgi:hypothetical protein
MVTLFCISNTLIAVNNESRTADFIYYYLFKLQMGFYPVAVYYNKTQHTTHITQITHHSQTITAHKTTQTIKDTLHIINTMQIQLQLQLNKLILIKNKYTIH